MNEYTVTVEATSKDEAREEGVRKAEREHGLWVNRVILVRETDPAGLYSPGIYEVTVQGDVLEETEKRALGGDR